MEQFSPTNSGETSTEPAKNAALSNRFCSKVIENLKHAYPNICHLCCGTCHGLLCEVCKDSLQSNCGNRCDHCDVPMEQAATYCSHCLTKPPSYSKLISAWVYHSPMNQLIAAFKDQHQHFWGAYLAQDLIERLHLAYEHTKPDLVIAVPLHWRKRLLRGFNQSHFIAHQLAKSLDLPYARKLKKVAATKAQKELSRQQRITNLRQTFKITGKVEGQYIALVDDVVTTGATVETLSRMLLKAGAKQVDVWALARTPRHSL